MAEPTPPVKLHALKRVAMFSGDTDVERWVDRMELALRIDSIPTESHADVLSLQLEGPAYDTWKGLSTLQKADAAAIKAELRSVFGLQRMDAWTMAASPSSMAPGDTVDVAFEELRKLVGIAAAGGDAIDRVAACLLTARLPTHVREQVLLQCGTDMAPAAVVACAKQLMSVSSSNVRTFSATAGVRKKPNATASASVQRPGRSSRVRDVNQIRCFRCDVLGHFAADCEADSPTHTAVSGNAGVGQPRE
jgi:hypothetical protein